MSKRTYIISDGSIKFIVSFLVLVNPRKLFEIRARCLLFYANKAFVTCKFL